MILLLIYAKSKLVIITIRDLFCSHLRLTWVCHGHIYTTMLRLSVSCHWMQNEVQELRSWVWQADSYLLQSYFRKSIGRFGYHSSKVWFRTGVNSTTPKLCRECVIRHWYWCCWLSCIGSWWPGFLERNRNKEIFRFTTSVTLRVTEKLPKSGYFALLLNMSISTGRLWTSKVFYLGFV